MHVVREPAGMAVTAGPRDWGEVIKGRVLTRAPEDWREVRSRGGGARWAGVRTPRRVVSPSPGPPRSAAPAGHPRGVWLGDDIASALPVRRQ